MYKKQVNGCAVISLVWLCIPKVLRQQRRILVEAFQWNAKLSFTSSANFVENNQMIITSRIYKFSARATVNQLSTKNVLV